MKRIVICSDGTGQNKLKKHPTNVLHTHRAVNAHASAPTIQMSWHDDGVGSGALLDRIFGGAFGTGLTKNMREAYTQLVNVYDPGDEVYLFGYSRGAFTVRSLVGLIRNVGLLDQEKIRCLDTAIELYQARNAGPNSDIAREFRARNSQRDIKIKFLGVWDTVGALGVPLRRLSRDKKWIRKYGFHDARLSGIVESAYQALAVDEEREVFAANLWQPPGQAKNPKEEAEDYDPGFRDKHLRCFEGAPIELPPLEESSSETGSSQTVEQMWFVGCHSDVGGGNKKSGLSNKTFCWMMEKAQDCGLMYDEDYVEEHIKKGQPDVINESRRKFYRLKARHHRPVGETWPEKEHVHSSVVDFKDRNQNIYPDLATRWDKGLAKYLSRH